VPNCRRLMARPRKQRRRNRGEGSIYPKTRSWRTKNGKTQSKTFWVASTPGADGKEFTGVTAEDAREQRDVWLRANGRALPRGERPKPITVAAFAETFLEHRKKTKRETTYRDYEMTLNGHLLPYLGDDKIGELSDERVKWLYKTLEGKVSASMRARVHRHLRALLNYALEQKVIKSSPLASIKQDVPRHRPSAVRPLEDAQVANLLKVAKGDRLAALFVAAVDTGARQGELFALEWPDIDLENRAINVRRAASEANGHVTLVPCKTKKSVRRVDISPETVATLRQRKALALKEGLGDCRLVFPSPHGQLLRKSNFIRKVWVPIRKKAGIPSARFHDLRHTCAVLLLKENVHPKIVSERLGHASVVITLDTYSAWIPSLQARAAEAMGEILGRLARRQKRLRVVA
jgi:integrase